jgi:TRAP-type C4-dicarboxylate transport system substrate-binding protein
MSDDVRRGAQRPGFVDSGGDGVSRRVTCKVRARRVAVVALFTLAALVSAPVLLAPAQARSTAIKLATLVPEGSVWDKTLRIMGSQWSQSTEGRVTLRVYPGGVAGDEPDVIRKIRIGQLHAAAITTAGLADIDPAFNVFNIPMFLNSYPELNAVLERMEPVLKQRLEEKGFVLLMWGHGGWVYFFTKEPVESLEGLSKAKLFVWAGDDEMVQYWRANGFQPVALAATDIMTGLQTGMIDAYPTTPLIALTLQWYRLTPNMVGLGMAPLVGGLVISKRTWERIDEADRAKILEACGRAERRLRVEVPRQDTSAVAEMRKRGLRVNAVSAEHAAEFREAAEEFANGMSGGRVPPEVLQQARRERDGFRRRNAPGGGR